MMTKQFENKAPITDKLLKDELSEQELEMASGGAAVDYFDKASPILWCRKAGGDTPVEY